jgi:hypothetical protein
VLTGLLYFLLAAAGVTLVYGIGKDSPDIIDASIMLTAFALLCQLVRRGTFMQTFRKKDEVQLEEASVQPKVEESEADTEQDEEEDEELESEQVVEIEEPSTIPFPEYDDQPVNAIIKRLAELSPDELDNARRYEKAHRGRQKILTRIEQLQRKAALQAE